MRRNFYMWQNIVYYDNGTVATQSISFQLCYCVLLATQIAVVSDTIKVVAKCKWSDDFDKLAQCSRDFLVQFHIFRFKKISTYFRKTFFQICWPNHALDDLRRFETILTSILNWLEFFLPNSHQCYKREHSQLCQIPIKIQFVIPNFDLRSIEMKISNRRPIRKKILCSDPNSITKNFPTRPRISHGYERNLNGLWCVESSSTLSTAQMIIFRSPSKRTYSCEMFVYWKFQLEIWIQALV